MAISNIESCQGPTGVIAHLHRLKIPPISVLLSDLGCPSQRSIARAVGVCPRTVRRWIERDYAPRPVMLALFWLTRWGRSELECSAINDARHMAQVADCHRREAEARLAEIRRLLSLGDFGAANSPLFPLAFDPRLDARQLADDGRSQDGPGDHGQGLADDAAPVRPHVPPARVVAR